MIKPFLILSPGRPMIRLHIFCSGLLGHLDMTMSPFSSLCNLTDIRSRSKTSLVYKVGSMDGPLHCNYISNNYVVKIKGIRSDNDKWEKMRVLTTTISPTYSYMQYVTHAHCTNPRITLTINLFSIMTKDRREERSFLLVRIYRNHICT